MCEKNRKKSPKKFFKTRRMTQNRHAVSFLTLLMHLEASKGSKIAFEVEQYLIFTKNFDFFPKKKVTFFKKSKKNPKKKKIAKKI